MSLTSFRCLFRSLDPEFVLGFVSLFLVWISFFFAFFLVMPFSFSSPAPSHLYHCHYHEWIWVPLFQDRSTQQFSSPPSAIFVSFSFPFPLFCLIIIIICVHTLLPCPSSASFLSFSISSPFFISHLLSSSLQWIWVPLFLARSTQQRSSLILLIALPLVHLRLPLPLPLPLPRSLPLPPPHLLLLFLRFLFARRHGVAVPMWALPIISHVCLMIMIDW